MKKLFFVLWLVWMGGLVACRGNAPANPDPGLLITPTLHPFFVQAEATPTPLPTEPSVATASPVVPTNPINYTEVVTYTIFDDNLDENWFTLPNDEVEIDLASTLLVHQGRTSIALTPLSDFVPMSLGVQENSTEVFSASQVVSLNFWLASDDVITLDDLVVTLFGSNDFPYWVEGDESVYIDGEFPFSETRLYFLGLNHTIPAHTWVEVIVVLNDLIYDPEYEFLTGFYLKNDAGFLNTIYLDDIRLMMLPPE